jgi:hypothetical protein
MHPTKRTPMWFRADPPPTWKPLLKHLPLDQRLARMVDRSLQIDAGDGE